MEELLGRVRAELVTAIDPAYRSGIKNYFREPIDPYGVRTPEVRRIAAQAYRELKLWPKAKRDRFCDLLWKSGRMEEGSIAVTVYRRFAKHCAGPEFRLFERWIDRYVRNWAHCDGVSSWLIAAAIENESQLMKQLPPWTRSRNRWKRRAAAVSLLQEAKQGRNTSAIFEIAALLHKDPDEMVQKGVGWLLKETYPKRPKETVAFLQERKADTPRMVLRYAAEKMNASDKASVLAKN